MSPNVHDKDEGHPMILAAGLCGNQSERSRAPDHQALVAGGNAEGEGRELPPRLCLAVQSSCLLRDLRPLAARSEREAKGGATPLMFAEIFQRTEIAEMLKKAGRK
jgi:hypothetical protein